MAVESFEREKGNSKKKPNGDKAVEKLSSSAKKLKCEMFLIKTFFLLRRERAAKRENECFGSFQLYNGIIKLDNF
jgi:hypothetical protein